MLQVDSYSRAMQQTYQPNENEVRYKYFSRQSFPESYLLIGLTKPTHMKKKIANCFAAAAPFPFHTIQQVLPLDTRARSRPPIAVDWIYA